MEQVKGEDDVSEEEDSEDESDDGDRDEQGSDVDLTDEGKESASVDALKIDQLEIGDDLNRSLSRSPPQSQREELQGNPSTDRVKDIVSSDIFKKQAQQQRKYHSKRSVRNAGRPKGSKAKQDTRVKVDKNDIWG